MGEKERESKKEGGENKDDLCQKKTVGVKQSQESDHVCRKRKKRGRKTVRKTVSKRNGEKKDSVHHKHLVRKRQRETVYVKLRKRDWE